MEVKIGVQYAPRELVLESAQSPAEIEQIVTDAFAKERGHALPDRREGPADHRSGRQGRLRRDRGGRRPARSGSPSADSRRPVAVAGHPPRRHRPEQSFRPADDIRSTRARSARASASSRR